MSACRRSRSASSRSTCRLSFADKLAISELDRRLAIQLWLRATEEILAGELVKTLGAPHGWFRGLTLIGDGGSADPMNGSGTRRSMLDALAAKRPRKIGN